jgi:hypothetical protein
MKLQGRQDVTYLWWMRILELVMQRSSTCNQESGALA